MHRLPTSEGKMIVGTSVLPLISDTVHSRPRPPTPTEPPTRTAVVPPAVAPRAIRAASSGDCESGSISVRCIVPSLPIASSRCCSILNRLTPSFLRLDPQVFVTTFPASSRPWRIAGVTPHADFDIQQPFFSFWKTCHQSTSHVGRTIRLTAFNLSVCVNRKNADKKSFSVLYRRVHLQAPRQRCSRRRIH